MDFAYLHFLQNIRLASADVFTPLMQQITLLAEGVFPFLLIAAIYWCIDKRMGQLMVWNMTYCMWLNQWIKKWFAIDRPWIRDETIVPVESALEGAPGYSFPSGHTAKAVATWGVLTYVLGWRKGCDRVKGASEQHESYGTTGRNVGILCFFILLLIMFSRNYLGVHTLSDVLASFVIGIVFIIVFNILLGWVENGNNRDVLVVLVSCFVLLLPMLKYGCLSNAGLSYGFLLGWLLERRFVCFRMDIEAKEKIYRFIPGASLVFLVKYSGANLLTHVMASKYAGFFANLCLSLFIVFLYPLIFSFVENKEIGMEIKKKWYRITACLMVAVLLIGSFFFIRRLCSHYDEFAGSVSEGQEVAQDKPNGEGQETAQDSSNGEGWETAQDSSNGENQEVTKDSLNTENQEAAQDTLNGGSVSEENLSGCPIKLIGHRGYPQIAPENTLASFKRAMDIGVDMIELDVQQTADGQLVIFHDGDLSRVTGKDGAIKDYTYDELVVMDAGGFFAPEFAGEKIPTLAEALELVKEHDDQTEIYLELKNIGDVPGFAEQVLDQTKDLDMTKRCLFASFNHDYLKEIKAADREAKILSNTSLGDAEKILEECDASYYGISFQMLRPDTIAKLHEAGKQVYVWAPDEPAQIRNAVKWGIDGVCTNDPGRVKVLLHPEYAYLSEHTITSIVVPGLYDDALQETDSTYVLQGMTKVGSLLVFSAYDKQKANSVLYLEDLEGRLVNRIDLGFVAHTGGISYDEKNDLLWVTGAEGAVNAISWKEIKEGSYQGKILYHFDGGLTNHKQNKVASFLTYNEGMLYVGSYTDGVEGKLRVFDITDPDKPVMTKEVSIPERIQGITFVGTGDDKEMLLSQSYQMEDAHLLSFAWDPRVETYREEDAIGNQLMPEGMEQIQMCDSGLYVLFESSARVYRETARIPNDQVWLVDYRSK